MKTTIKTFTGQVTEIELADNATVKDAMKSYADAYTPPIPNFFAQQTLSKKDLSEHPENYKLVFLKSGREWKDDVKLDTLPKDVMEYGLGIILINTKSLEDVPSTGESPSL